MNNKHRIISFVAVILGFFMALLDTTIVNITLPKITDYFNSTMTHISWVVNVYNLVFASMIITASRLADQFGRKKLFIFGVLLFTICSIFSGLSNSVGMLVTFRALQGLSAAFVVPVTVPLSAEIFPPEKRGPIMALWGAFAGLAAASGPSLGGILTQFFSWRAIFFINIPIGILCVLMTKYFIKESYDPTADKNIDVAGILSISTAMFSLIFALIKGNDKGWTSPFIITLFILSAIAVLLFIIIELKSKKPMIPLSLFKIVPFSSGAIALFLLGLGMMSGSYFLSFFLIQVKGLTQLSAGLVVSSMSVSSMFFSMLSAALSKRISSRWISSMGLCLLALSCLLYSTLTQNSTTLGIILRLVVAGSGMGLSMSTLMNSMVKNVPPTKIGISSGINNMTRTLGTFLGVAVFLSIFTSNIKVQMVDAKRAAVKIVKADTVFNNEAKTGMINSLKQGNGSKFSDVSSILKTIAVKEKATLKAAPIRAKAEIKHNFAVQRKETKKLYPLIQDTFKTYTVHAFSFTFKCASLILLPGILFAFFSDTKKKSKSSAENSYSEGTEVS
ncbi:MFS transporter [Clostridium oryzae]|uniref:Multidrug resistance protein Stp n=1 Tax=Clostridium oryzae TaxID=1450648 RepID=A0A1V4IEF7_9CLOT|nr:MFS transporter [Clostridium oryzae]OPJ58316.1 multidrug resistance protein Stp [Clostridium oryzae]